RILFYIIKRSRVPLKALSGRLFEKCWAPHVGVPVVIDEVMKAGLCYRPAQSISVVIFAAFKGNHQIEWATGDGACSSRDHARIFKFGCAYATFVGMSREEFNRRTIPSPKKIVLCQDVDLVIIAVGARMIIWIIDMDCIRIITLISFRIGIRIFRVKIVGCSDPAESAERRAQIMMV